jgi:hypothetical protein
VPFTFLAHQGPVLPLKLVAPRWFDGTALVVGSALPDLAQAATNEIPFTVNAHTKLALLVLWPFTIAIAVVVKRWVAPVLGPHLPDRPPLHLRDYGALGRWPGDRPLPRAGVVLAVSALVGLVSHIALDAFTHQRGLVVRNLEALQGIVVTPVGVRFPVFYALQLLVTALGAAIAVASLAVIGRRRIVRDTYGPPAWRATPASRRLVVGATLAGAVLGVVVAGALRHRGSPTNTLLRPVVVAFLGLLIGCLAARRHLVPADA